MLHESIYTEIIEQNSTLSRDEFRQQLQRRFSEKETIPARVLQTVGIRKKSLSAQERARQERISSQLRTTLIDHLLDMQESGKLVAGVQPDYRSNANIAFLLGHPDFFHLKKENAEAIMHTYLSAKKEENIILQGDDEQNKHTKSFLPQKIVIANKKVYIEKESGFNESGMPNRQEVKPTILDREILYSSVLIAVEKEVREMSPHLEEMDEEYLIRNAEKIWAINSFLGNLETDPFTNPDFLAGTGEEEKQAREQARNAISFLQSKWTLYSAANVQLNYMANPYFSEYTFLMERVGIENDGLEDFVEEHPLLKDFFRDYSSILSGKMNACYDKMVDLLQQDVGVPSEKGNANDIFAEKLNAKPVDEKGSIRKTGDATRELLLGGKMIIKVPEGDVGGYRLISLLPPEKQGSIAIKVGSSTDFFDHKTPENIRQLKAQLKEADKFLITGSVEFASMQRMLSMLEQDFKSFKEGGQNLSTWQRCKDLLEDIQLCSDQYLEFKQQQRGNLNGKNDRERSRIEAAQSVKNFAEKKLSELQLMEGSASLMRTLRENEETYWRGNSVSENYPELVQKRVEELPHIKSEGGNLALSRLDAAVRRDMRALCALCIPYHERKENLVLRNAPAAKPFNAEQLQDIQIRMARIVIHAVISQEGNHGPMRQLYIADPVKLVENYSQDKGLHQQISELTNPQLLAEFLKEGRLSYIAKGIVNGRAQQKGKGKAKPEPEPILPNDGDSVKAASSVSIASSKKA